MTNATHNNEKSDTTIVSLPADFSGFSVEKFKEQFDELASSSKKKIILDFSETEFIDSSGIGAMVFLFKRLEKRSAEMALLRVHGQPFKLMNLLRVDRTIRFIESV
ncbi:possible anti-sigma factor antagonist [Pseudoalteromonas luteoviolacea B = ATCC 29581]|nr:possible anti-sigma factor antagonist [Pseudoalteromonas luteoviolacea B = ATCC 29581]